MCRLTAYKGRPLLIGDLIVKPENGLLYQSRDAAWHPGVADGIGKRNIRVNADGFGVAWYSRETLTSEESVEKQVGSHTYGGAGIHGLRAYMYESCVYKFVTPAWSSRNLKNIGEHVQSSLIFAHIRAGSNGLLPEESFNISVTEENCHPFQYRQWTFMHNGGVPNFGSIKLPIVHLLDELCWNGIAGSTYNSVFCYTIVLPSFLVCDDSVSLYRFTTACLHSLILHDTSLTILSATINHQSTQYSYY
jgi:glutamine amidotransferase